MGAENVAVMRCHDEKAMAGSRLPGRGGLRWESGRQSASHSARQSVPKSSESGLFEDVPMKWQ